MSVTNCPPTTNEQLSLCRRPGVLGAFAARGLLLGLANHFSSSMPAARLEKRGKSLVPDLWNWPGPGLRLPTAFLASSQLPFQIGSINSLLRRRWTQRPVWPSDWGPGIDSLQAVRGSRV